MILIHRIKYDGKTSTSYFVIGNKQSVTLYEIDHHVMNLMANGTGRNQIVVPYTSIKT